MVGRGLAVGDVDNDGRADLLILNQGEPLSFLHNVNSSPNSLTLGLRGKSSNRDAVGAEIRVTVGGESQSHWRVGGGSFLSASDPRVHIGLGDEASATPLSIEVRWPNGRIERHKGLKPGAGYQIVEGGSNPQPLKGWPDTTLKSDRVHVPETP